MGIGEDFEQDGTISIEGAEGVDALLHLWFVLGFQVDDVVLAADALGGGGVGTSHEVVGNGALRQARKHAEDATATVVEQEDAQVATKVLIPQGVLVVEEAKVADDTEQLFVSNNGEPRRRRQRALNAIDATIAPYVVTCVDVG